jgi:hypothetical protein
MTQVRRTLGPTEKSLDAGSTIQASCNGWDIEHGFLVIVVTSPARVFVVRGRDVLEDAGVIVLSDVTAGCRLSDAARDPLLVVMAESDVRA